jgi:nucleoside-triphosphatase THEP1
MIYIITGDKDVGKTSKIKEIYLEKGGDGFISEKIIKDDIFYGYKLTRLSTGESREFIYENRYAPVYWTNVIRNIRFTFSIPAFDAAESWIDEIINKGISPIYIDEVGKLELKKQGFYTALKKLVNHNKNVYIGIRKDYVMDFIKKFDITQYDIECISE